MRVTVKPDLCQGHAQCEGVAPEIFTVGEDTVAHVLLEYPSEEVRAKLEEVVWRCPTEAIVLEES